MTPEHSYFWLSVIPRGTYVQSVDKQKGCSYVTFFISTDTLQSHTT